MIAQAVFCHEKAIVETSAIGLGTRIWAFAHILPGAQIGSNCNICDHVFIENDVIIGNRVTVKCGVQLWDGIHIEDDVFIGPNATFTNDPWPRSRQWSTATPKTLIHAGASIGANATILPGLTIGKCAMVGAGAVVTNSVPPYAVVAGNPARILRFASSADPNNSVQSSQPNSLPQVPGLSLDIVPIVRDLRGNLVAREVGKGLPFEPVRFFVIINVPTKELRGSHAHKKCHQLLICLRGSVKCLVDDGTNRAEHLLDSPEAALHLAPMTWGSQYHYTNDAILLVLASHPYDPEDYIRDYNEFQALKGIS